MGEALELSAWPKVGFDQWAPIDALAAIESLDLGSADENACLGAAVVSARLVRRLQAVQAMALARACDLAEAGRSSAGATYEVIDGVDLVAAEAGLALTLSKGEAAGLVEDAVQVTRDLPRLTALAHEGGLDWALAAKTHHRLSRALEPGTPAWRQAEALLADRLPGKTWDAAGAATWRVLYRINPKAATERARKAQQECYLRISPLPDGMARIDGRLRADDARLINLNLDANADAARDHARVTGHADQRTHQQRRVAYFVSIFRSIHTGTPLRYANPPTPSSASAPKTPYTPAAASASTPSAEAPPAGATSTASTTAPDTSHLTKPVSPSSPIHTSHAESAHLPTGGPPSAEGIPASEGILAWWEPPPPPTRHGHLPHLNITLTLEALLTITDEPGILHGHGYLPAELLREIALQARKLVLTLIPSAPNAQPSRLTQYTSHGPGDQANCTETTRPYRPRQTVIDQVLGRFPTCSHPGCTVDAAKCDIDHVIPYGKRGSSCPCNLVPLCRLHHRLKTHAGWNTRLTRPDEPYPPGTIEYTSRLGQRHIQLPPPLPGAPDPEDNLTAGERAQRRKTAWQSELRRVDPSIRPAPAAQPETKLGEPPF